MDACYAATFAAYSTANFLLLRPQASSISVLVAQERVAKSETGGEGEPSGMPRVTILVE